MAIGRPIITAVLREAGQQAVRDYSLGIDFNLRNPLVERWLGDRMRTFSRDITDTTRDAISEQLREAHRLGESIPQMQRRIEGYFDQQGPMRAERIARTETVFASNRGAIEAYRQSGVVDEWEWLVAFDPCPICEPYAGRRFGLDAPHPPFLHPQCRCASAGIVKEEKAVESRCPDCHRFLGEGLSGDAYCPRCNRLVGIKK